MHHILEALPEGRNRGQPSHLFQRKFSIFGPVIPQPQKPPWNRLPGSLSYLFRQVRVFDGGVLDYGGVVFSLRGANSLPQPWAQWVLHFDLLPYHQLCL